MQIVVLMPVLFLLMFTGMQAALIYHARTVAIAAAQEGARTAAAQFSSAAAGDAAAEQFIASAGGGDVLRGVTVRTTRDATTTSVAVSGETMSVVPGWTPRIVQSASAPVERVTG
ncbi:TadE family protein [Pengzhenrongella frigida]|uniref:TadE family protein n=1 Tax=Pengzhenrongella frigida TaxID=1259133 RepID=UPI001F5CF684|nr:TadE family protein [Cellulomonas sp. HLT2-17]